MLGLLHLFLTNEDFTYGKIPTRMMYLRDIPERNMLESYTAWQRLKQVQEYKPLIYTDIYRSPASSAEAYARKVGVAKPGYSGHNYGISVDVAVEASMRRHKITYTQLCNIMIVNVEKKTGTLTLLENGPIVQMITIIKLSQEQIKLTHGSFKITILKMI